MNQTLPATVDVLVVGGGPAGLSAATWLGRYQRSTTVVDTGQQRNLPADHAHGLLSRDPTTPQELLTQARSGLDQYPQVSLHRGTVTAIHRDRDTLFRALIDGAEVRAQRVVLATGVRDRFPEIAGFGDHYGTDVFHCLACDGYSVRGQAVIVLGAGEHVPAYAAELLDWTDDVCIVTDTTGRAFNDDQRAVLADQGIGVVDGVAETLIGAPGTLTGVQLADGDMVRARKCSSLTPTSPPTTLPDSWGASLTTRDRSLLTVFISPALTGSTQQATSSRDCN